MPTYEYACSSCGQHLEVVQSFTDDALTECPNCGGALRKVFGNIGIVLKGSGFYKTDSRPQGGAKKGRSEAEAGSGSSSTSDGSSAASSSSSGDSGSGSSSSGDKSSAKSAGKKKDTASSGKKAAAS